MKIFLLSISLISTIPFHGFAQDMSEKEVIGTWKLMFDIEETIVKEADEADTMFEEVFIKAISGFVGGILEDIDIYLDFRKGGDLRITINAYDETETEKGSWYINKSGYLIIDDIGDGANDIQIDTDIDEWKLMDGILVNDVMDDEKSVYMTRVD